MNELSKLEKYQRVVRDKCGKGFTYGEHVVQLQVLLTWKEIHQMWNELDKTDQERANQLVY